MDGLASDPEAPFTPILNLARRRSNELRRAGRHPLKPSKGLALRRVEKVGIADGDFDPRGYFVYLLFEADTAAPFYVGRSANILGRLGSHHATYGPQIVAVRLISCETKDEMEGLERTLILKHLPKGNILGVRPRLSAAEGP